MLGFMSQLLYIPESKFCLGSWAPRYKCSRTSRDLLLPQATGSVLAQGISYRSSEEVLSLQTAMSCVERHTCDVAVEYRQDRKCLKLTTPLLWQWAFKVAAAKLQLGH